MIPDGDDAELMENAYNSNANSANDLHWNDFQSMAEDLFISSIGDNEEGERGVEIDGEGGNYIDSIIGAIKNQ